ncbi:MAG: DUF5011 domain-containing protein [Hahellaceae bacterium]|nr:DUF5011 domain-containing protein [Hahellaceae bacterium]
MKKMLTTRMSFVVLMAVSPLAAAFTNGSDCLLANDYMTSNQYRPRLMDVSVSTCRATATLVLRNSAGSAVWSTQTNGSGGVRLLLQNDANTVITLSGSASMSVNKGSSFADPGATASDNVDCNITIRIVKTGSVNTATVGTYTLSYNVSDAAGNAANTVTRTVTVTAPPPTTPPATPPGNGDNDGKAASTGQFSAPSAALYTLNNAKQRVFPRHIDTGFGGNGHAETLDGHVFVRTRTAGWFASAFRPQRIVLNSDGSPNFANAFGNNDIAGTEYRCA